MSAQEKKDATPYLNVTPLIDVLLVLLIIFMVVTPLKPSRFKALIPQPPNPYEDRKETWDLMLRVDILKDLRLQLNGHDIGSVNDTSALSAMLSDVLRERERMGTLQPGTDRIMKTVFIKAPRSVRYGEVAKVIDGVKGAGASPLGLQVDDLPD